MNETTPPLDCAALAAALDDLAIGAAICLIGRSTFPIFYVNPALCALTDQASTELVGRDYLTLADAASGPALERALRHAADGRVAVVARAAMGRGGAVWEGSLHIAPHVSADGQLVALTVMCCEVGEARAAEPQAVPQERTRRQSDQQGRSLADLMPETILRFDANNEQIELLDAPSDARAIEVTGELLVRVRELGRQTIREQRSITHAYTQRYRIGRYLLADARVTEAQLETALAEQLRLTRRGEQCRIGDVLRLLGYIADADLERALRQQAVDRVSYEYEIRAIPTGGAQVLVLLRDIGERQHALDMLRASEQRYRTITDTSPDAVVQLDHAARIVYVSRQAMSLFGVAQESDLIGSVWAAHVVPDEHSRWQERLAATAGRADEAPLLDNEYLLLRSDGAIYPADIGISRIGDDLTPQGFILVIRDSSERRAARDALAAAYQRVSSLNEDLRRSRDLLRTLVDGLDDGVVLVDRDGAVLATNRAIANLYGVAPQSLVETHWQATCEMSWPLVMITIGGGESQRGRALHRAPGGGSLLLDVQTLPLMSEDGKVEQVIVHLVNVTDRVQLEARVMENERFAASGRLAAIVAHEINSPLQALQTLLYLIENGVPNQQKYVALASHEIARVGRIVRQLLDVYHPAAANFGPVVVATLIDRTLRLIDQQLAQYRATIERRLAHDVPDIWGRSDQLTQVLINLLLNAAQSMPDGGPIVITSEQRTMDGVAAAAISISDRGSGIAPDQLERIFDPFFTTRTDGNGLGLAICSEIVAEHGGRLNVESALREGSTFTLLVPLYRL